MRNPYFIAAFRYHAVTWKPSYELHADDAHTVVADLLDVGDNLGTTPTFRVVIFRIHLRAVVVHADHGYFEPLIAGNGGAGRPWTEAPWAELCLLVLRLEDSILPSDSVRPPRSRRAGSEEATCRSSRCSQVYGIHRSSSGFAPARVVTLDIKR